MSTMLKIAALYSDKIVDDRTSADVLAHMKLEVIELEDEISAAENDNDKGEDGIFGEAIDIIACAVDIIRREHPDMSLEELESLCADYMHAKCEKWLVNVEARKYT